jgi:hypothetical protein
VTEIVKYGDVGVEMIFPNSIKGKLPLAILFIFFLGLLLGLQSWRVQDIEAESMSPAVSSAPILPKLTTESLAPTNCRYGVGFVPNSPASLAWIPTLRAGWFANFSIYEPPEPNSEFVFTVRLRQVMRNGERFPDYTVFPKLVDSYVENGQIRPGLGFFIRRAPGALWLVGNEIEIDNNLQDNIMPDIYATAYHDIYHYIKSVDPTAKVAIGGVLQVTPGRLQYLDIVLDTYRARYGVKMPVDVWNIHLYILPERTMREEPQNASGKIALGTDPNIAIFSTGLRQHCPNPNLPDTPENDPRHDVYCRSEHTSVRIFREQITELRRWMKNRGEQNKPLIISEYGSLVPFLDGQPDGSCSALQDEFNNCFHPERVTRFLIDTTTFMENTKNGEIGYPADDYRLVQRWLWYSIYTPFGVGQSSNLLVDNYNNLYPPAAQGALSMIGNAFQSQADLHSTVNLAGRHASSVNIFVDTPEDLGKAAISASYSNLGSLSITQPFRVTFYSDPDFSQPIGSVEVDPQQTGAVMGCSWINSPQMVHFEWEGLPVGTHHYWAVIDSDNRISETNEADNVTSRGEVIVYSETEFAYELFIPVSRGD